MNASNCESPRASGVNETRFGKRIALELPINLDIGGRTVGRGLLRNASISGAFVDTLLELPVFTNLVVKRNRIGDEASGCYELPACVVRRAPQGFAVEWRDMACPALIELLERCSGRRVVTVHDDLPIKARQS
jgi:hypothetical protein